ncbi:MAG: phospholipid carrier-dependent glycosyltransferase [Chloroflexota bacterium]|nr:phospholipid carrier-dependent glycosyltransferase [Chloroflexota bacterium]
MIRLRRLLDTLFLLALAAYILAGTTLTPFHADEATQIHMSRDFAYQLLQGDYARLRYDPAAPLTAETQLRLINGTVNKYAIGLAWWLAGYTVDDLNSDWDWGGGWDYNVSSGRLPSDGVLNAARLPSALFTAAGAVVMFALGWQLGGRPTAYLAALLYALHPVLLLNGRRAMMEGSLTFFSLLTVLAALRFARRGSWAGALALGVAGGLTIASKHTGAATVAAVFVACGVWAVVRLAAQALIPSPSSNEKAATRNRIGVVRSELYPFLRLCVAALVVMGVFLVLNPAWWGGDTVQIGQTILQWRTELLDIQAQLPGAYADSGEQGAGWLRFVTDMQPQYYEIDSWSDIPAMQVQIAAYAASPWTGIMADGAGVVITLLALVGVLLLLIGVPAQPTPTRLVLIVWALAMVAITWSSPLAWQRYYLPVYPAIALLAAYGPVGVWRWWRAVRAAREQAAKPAQI